MVWKWPSMSWSDHDHLWSWFDHDPIHHHFGNSGLTLTTMSKHLSEFQTLTVLFTIVNVLTLLNLRKQITNQVKILLKVEKSKKKQIHLVHEDSMNNLEGKYIISSYPVKSYHTLRDTATKIQYIPWSWLTIYLLTNFLTYLVASKADISSVSVIFLPYCNRCKSMTSVAPGLLETTFPAPAVDTCTWVCNVSVEMRPLYVELWNCGCMWADRINACRSVSTTGQSAVHSCQSPAIYW